MDSSLFRWIMLFRRAIYFTFYLLVLWILFFLATKKSSKQHQLNSSAIASSVKRSASTGLKSSSQYVDILDPTQQAIVFDVIVVGCGPAGLTASLYASRMGLSVLVIETDSPYLIPRNLNPKPKSNRNEPKNLFHIATEIAKLRNENIDEICNATYQNSIDFFSQA